MKRRDSIAGYLILTLLIGQIASIWHAVGHLEFPHDQTHDHKVITVHDVLARSELAAVYSHEADGLESDEEQCLIYHTFGANQLLLSALPQMPGIVKSPDLYQVAEIQFLASYVAHAQIRGPPVRS